jgi:hemoglobin-like flavoprotein
MSNNAIPDDVRLRLAESIAVVERHRPEIMSKMQAQLAALETEDEAFGQAEVTGMMLVNLLMESASDLAACGAVGDLGRVAGKHRRLEIDGRHYSRFGIALALVLREVLGPSLSPRIASAWCEAFWFTIRHMSPDEAPEPHRLLNASQSR